MVGIRIKGEKLVSGVHMHAVIVRLLGARLYNKGSVDWKKVYERFGQGLGDGESKACELPCDHEQGQVPRH